MKMNKEKQKYFSMFNMFNILTSRATYDDIYMSNIPHVYIEPQHNVTFRHINNMINYFEALEMYEQCKELLDFRRDDFNDNGTKKTDIKKCECVTPKVNVYSQYSKCLKCGTRIL